jgi:hypothetical protein
MGWRKKTSGARIPNDDMAKDAEESRSEIAPFAPEDAGRGEADAPETKRRRAQVRADAIVAPEITSESKPCLSHE